MDAVGSPTAALKWFKQSAFRWRAEGLTVYIDPWGVTEAEPADVVFLTHAHDDHFAPDDLERVRGPRTRVFAPADVAAELSGDVVAVRPGDSLEFRGLRAEVVPAYNVREDRLDKHPRSRNWVGYVLDLGERRCYHAGDTDRLPELEVIRADLALLPVGGTFTMDASEAAGLARAMAPGVAVPMHYGYLAGTPADAERFAREAAPVRVEVLTPAVPFDRP